MRDADTVRGFVSARPHLLKHDYLDIVVVIAVAVVLLLSY